MISHLNIPIIGVWTAEFTHLDSMQTQPWQPDRPRYHLTAFSGGWISGATGCLLPANRAVRYHARMTCSPMPPADACASFYWKGLWHQFYQTLPNSSK